MIRKYQKGDALKIKVQKEQQEEAKEFAAFFDEIAAYTFEENGEILAVTGYRVTAPQQAECFALLSKNCAPKLLALVRFLKREIAVKMKQKNVSSLIMTVKKNFYPACHLAHLLGFQFKAELPQFFKGNDYQLLERKK